MGTVNVGVLSHARVKEMREEIGVVVSQSRGRTNVAVVTHCRRYTLLLERLRVLAFSSV
jgi:hypothetical protein